MAVELLSVTPDAEELIENAGRTCYQSSASDSHVVGDLVRKLIKSGHHSVLEHAYATFRISEVSRALTHQLVRHRLVAYSQKSQRYVKEGQFEYVIPHSIQDMGPIPFNKFNEQMKTIQKWYDEWKEMGLRNEDARFVLPNACYTEIVMSANFREFRHIFAVRCDKHAQWEIRAVAKEMLRQLHEKAPSVFDDQVEIFLPVSV